MDTGEKKSFGGMAVSNPRDAFLIHEKNLDRTRGLLHELVKASGCELTLQRLHSERVEALFFLFRNEAKLPEPSSVEKSNALAARQLERRAGELGELCLFSHARERPRHPQVHEHRRTRSSQIKNEELAASFDPADSRALEPGFHLAARLPAT